MKHRVSGGAILVKDESILLVKHVEPDRGKTYWVGPGGRVEKYDSSIYDCVRRETFEETGLTIELGPIVYLGERFDPQTNTLHFGIFILGTGYSGDLTIRNIKGKGPDEHLIKDVRWIHRRELRDIVVYPQMLRNEFWEDLARGFPEVKYLGRML